MSKSSPTFSIVKWGLGVALAHRTGSMVLMQLLETVNLALFTAGLTATRYGEPLHVVRELTMAGLALSHMPLLLIEGWLPPIEPLIARALLASEALFQGFVAVILVQWLVEPPRFFVRFGLPFMTRRTVLSGLALAAAHFLLSMIIYCGARIALAASATTGSVWAADEALRLLHPLLDINPRQYSLREPTTLAAMLAGAIVWGFVVVWAGLWLRRLFWQPVPEPQS